MAMPYVPTTHVDGVAGGFDAADANHLELGVRDAQLSPSVRVYHNATQAITTGTETALAFNTERWDQAFGSSAAHHDTATNNSRLTALYAGIYLVQAHVEWTLEATGNRAAFFRINA